MWRRPPWSMSERRWKDMGAVMHTLRIRFVWQRARCNNFIAAYEVNCAWATTYCLTCFVHGVYNGSFDGVLNVLVMRFLGAVECSMFRCIIVWLMCPCTTCMLDAKLEWEIRNGWTVHHLAGQGSSYLSQHNLVCTMHGWCGQATTSTLNLCA